MPRDTGYDDLSPALSPFDELEDMDRRVELAGLDEQKTMFDPDTDPRKHRASDPDEPVCDDCGRLADIQDDTPIVDDLLRAAVPGARVDLMSDTIDVEDELGVFEL